MRPLAVLTVLGLALGLVMSPAVGWADPPPHAKAARGGCPPGLAKKNPPCVPPGQAKKLWSVGQPLSPTIVVGPVPPDIVIRLPAPPPGHRYGYVDGDVLLIATATQVVVQAMRGLSR